MSTPSPVSGKRQRGAGHSSPCRHCVAGLGTISSRAREGDAFLCPRGLALAAQFSVDGNFSDAIAAASRDPNLQALRHNRAVIIIISLRLTCVILIRFGLAAWRDGVPLLGRAASGCAVSSSITVRPWGGGRNRPCLRPQRRGQRADRGKRRNKQKVDAAELHRDPPGFALANAGDAGRGRFMREASSHALWQHM